MTNYILIDLSYFIFYRYFALIQWWKMAKQDEPLTVPFENPEFCEKFKKTFIEKLNEIPKRLRIKSKDYIIIGARDCPRQDIWRNELFDNYKGTRGNDDAFMGGPFFKMAYDLLVEATNCRHIIKFDSLEADDCIALTTMYLKNKYPDQDTTIHIIANDMDYLQLADTQTHIINLKYKDLQDSKTSTRDAKKDLFLKTVIGDKSDNIPGIFKKCGIKTAQKYYDDKELFESMLKKENAYAQYEKNKKIIDFNEIPEILANKFRETISAL